MDQTNQQQGGSTQQPVQNQPTVATQQEAPAGSPPVTPLSTVPQESVAPPSEVPKSSKNKLIILIFLIIILLVVVGTSFIILSQNTQKAPTAPAASTYKALSPTSVAVPSPTPEVDLQSDDTADPEIDIKEIESDYNQL